tara:strand:- start:328 stop:1404 length:1077 start_codon:yes stop_codon:yes gene_type:complete
MATYDNDPNSMAINRINFDINRLDRDRETLENEKIYFKFYQSDNLNTKYKQLIIGPKDTPYEGGFYLFDAQFPDQYPFHPPKMKTRTQGEGVRKHPNLYVSGKCCFSFLGTWSGPPWTACQNPYTVAFSMRSVLTKEPLRNEPGYENVNDSRQNIYEYIIDFFNLKWGVCNIVNEILNESGVVGKEFICFKNEILNYFYEHFNSYLDQLDKFKNDDGKVIDSPVYGFKIKINYSELKENILNLNKQVRKIFEQNTKKKTPVKKKSIIKKDLKKNDKKVVNSQLETTIENKSKNIKSKKFQKGFPQISITKFSVGDIIDIHGNNCNNLKESLAKNNIRFKIIQIVYPSGRKIKRWKKIE